MAVYFVRHGQTDWNVEHRIQGSVDTELNEVGIRQAEQMRDKLASMNFAAIYTSPLQRARNTAKIIAQAHKDASLIEAPEIAERNFGTYEGMSNGPGDNYYGLFDYSKDVKAVGGESLGDLATRVYPFLETIRKNHKEKDVLIVAHQGIGLIIREYFRGRPKSGDLMELSRLGNGEVEKLEFIDQA